MIKELNDIEPDCKCEYIIVRDTFDIYALEGCLETLVQYQKLFATLYLQGDDPERDGLLANCRSILKRLEEIDPFRKRRYQELGTYYYLPRLCLKAFVTPLMRSRRTALT